MRTHVDSIWINPDDAHDAAGEFSDEKCYACDVEYVPAAAYLELKKQLVEAWSAGYVAGQECAKDGAPRRYPFSVVEKGEKQ